MPSTGPQNEWVRRVLGVSPGALVTPRASRPTTADLTAARNGLVRARDAMTEGLSKADAQIRKLQAVLAVHPDSDLKDIAASADFGINALPGGYRVRMLAALYDVDAAPAEKLPAALARLRTVVAGFETYIRDSDRLAACDGNPLGVAVGVRALLGPALAELARSVQTFAA